MPDPVPAARAPLALAVATFGGVGLIRPASGTWATVATGLIIAPVLIFCPAHSLNAVFAVLAVLASIAGIWSAPAAIRRWNRMDPGQVVIDEVAGTLVAVACIPAATLVAQPLLAVAVAMALFRVFDIVKPYPVSWLEALHGAVGIMADDLAAGLLAGILSAALLA